MAEDPNLTLLESVFGEGNVLKEWDVSKESADALQRNLQYCPRIDFAIKPLNINAELGRNNDLINQQLQKYSYLIQDLQLVGLYSGEFWENPNPRCFLAIEYENKTTTKHKLGSLINASALGKIGIIVAFDKKIFKSYERIVKYLEFIKQAKKLEMKISNYIVVLQDSFEQTLTKYMDR